MARRTGLTGLSLSGFQVFDELTDIPLERLTLLFGPNSAGKSAVEDAITLLRGLSSPWPQEAYPSSADILRHWRRTGGGPREFTREMRLHARFAHGTDIHEDFCITAGWELKSPELYQSPAPCIDSFELQTTLTLDDGRPRVTTREIVADGALLLRIDYSGKYSVNFAHPALGLLRVDSDWAQTADRIPEILSWENGVATLTRPASTGITIWNNPNVEELIQAIRISSDPSFAQFIQTLHLLEGPSMGHLRSAALDCESQIREFFVFLTTLETTFRHYAYLDFSFVPASRRIPTPDDLTLLVGPNIEDESSSRFPFQVSGDERYRPVVESYVASLRDASSHTPETEQSERTPAHEDVNVFLTHHLFSERGYRLAFKYFAVISSENLPPHEEEAEFTADWIRGQPIVVRILLVDAQGREFSFDDVGSGLGYVLPVLVELSKAHRPLTLLQQPELHLHPALQAAMGDVLIEATSKAGIVVAETHSEHLLLRILKRIRQTSRRSVATELHILPEEVSVLYFEPMCDGTTSVRRLRVDEEGEFIDRWPHGFFEERDNEFLDE